MKRFLRPLLAAAGVLLALTACQDTGQTGIVSGTRRLSATGTTEDGLKYSVYSDQTATITGYIGTAEALVVPETVGGVAVREIGGKAFQFGTVTSVALPEGLTTIGEQAFGCCYRLTELGLPSTLTSVGEYAFTQCARLRSVTLPQGLTKLGPYAFSGCSSLESLHLPPRITQIPAGLCDHCEMLTEITWDGTVVSIGEYAFSRCLSLESFRVPETVTALPKWCFAECSSLFWVELPRDLLEIQECAFYSCPALREIRYAGTEDDWRTVVIHEKAMPGAGNYTILCSES